MINLNKEVSGTVREAILQNEIDRIRRTYSFKLGLLLTDSFVRRPWMIPLLPFTFLKMNYDYILSRNNSEEGESTAGIEGNCLMIMTTSEEGAAASDRAISIAKAWNTSPDRKIVVVSTNELLTSMAIKGVSLYQIPDPKTHRDISTTEWNETCANVLKRAIETHRPFSFIFQGTYPYRGVLNAISISPNLNSIWLRPEDTDEELIRKNERAFSSILTLEQINGMGDTKTSDVDEPLGKRTPSDLILVATGYNRHSERDRLPKILDRKLSGNADYRFVFPKNADVGNIPLMRIERWDTILDHEEFVNLKAAITRSDLHLVKELRRCGVPTLCIIESDTPSTTIKRLQREAMSGGLFVTYMSNSDEINLFLNALFNSEWNGTILSRGREGAESDWYELFQHCNIAGSEQ